MQWPLSSKGKPPVGGGNDAQVSTVFLPLDSIFVSGSVSNAFFESINDPCF